MQIFDFRGCSFEHNPEKSKGWGFTSVFVEKMRKAKTPAVRSVSVMVDLKWGTF